MSRYVIAVAANQQPLPTVVDITYVPEYSWPLWHAAFQRNTLTGLWWYAPFVDAAPTLLAALERFTERDTDLGSLVAPQDFRGVEGNARVLARLISFASQWGDAVIAVGVE